MADAIDTRSESSKLEYLQQNKSVQIRETIERGEKLKASGLENIEIRQKAKELGKDDFLKLLITQLTHQDPTSPVQDQQFIAQMAQFSSLEQMQNMATKIGQMSDRQAMSLVGKFVMGKDFTGEGNVSGIVQALFFDQVGVPFLKVGGRVMAVSDVTLISDPSTLREEAQNSWQGRPAQAIEAKPSPRPKTSPQEDATSPKRPLPSGALPAQDDHAPTEGAKALEKPASYLENLRHWPAAPLFETLS